MSNGHVNQAFGGILNAICPPAAQPVEPLTVEVSEDQNTARQTLRLEFVEAACSDGLRPCLVCVGSDNQDLCERLPCYCGRRKDGRNGYFRKEVRG
jgi:hypothetical protein